MIFKKITLLLVMCSTARAGGFDFEDALKRADSTGLQADDYPEKNSAAATCLLLHVIHSGRSCEVRESEARKLFTAGAEIPEPYTEVKAKAGGLFSATWTCHPLDEFKTAVQNRCAGITGMIADRISAGEIRRIVDLSEVQIFAASSSEAGKEGKFAENRKVYHALSSAVDSRCKSQGSGDFCELKKYLSEQESRLLGEERHYANSDKYDINGNEIHEPKDGDLDEQGRTIHVLKAPPPKGSKEAMQKDACEASKAIGMADQMIAHEKEVTAETGMVNKAALYQAGQMKVLNKHSLERLKSDFQKKTGKAVSLDGCQAEKLY